MREGKGGKGGQGVSRGTDLLTISGYVSSCRPSPKPSREALCTCSADRSWEFGEQETDPNPPIFFPTPQPFPFLCAPICPPTHTQPIFTPCYALSSTPGLLALRPPIAHTSALNSHVVHSLAAKADKGTLPPLPLSKYHREWLTMWFHEFTWQSKGRQWVSPQLMHECTMAFKGPHSNNLGEGVLTS